MLQEIERFWEQVCFDPDYQPSGRMADYRQIIFDGMFEVLQNICSVCREVVKDKEFRLIFWDFLKNQGPRSVILRELPKEVARYLRTASFPFSDKYPYLSELMEYEYLEIEVKFAPDPLIHQSHQLYLNPAHKLFESTWPVHFISQTRHRPQNLPRGKYYLFLWREPVHDEVMFLELNSLFATLISCLRDSPPNAEILLREVAEREGIEFTQEFIDEGKNILKELRQQAILL